MVLLYYLRNILKPEIYGPGYRGMMVQGFYEAPYLTMCMLGVPLPFLFLPYIIYKHKKLGGDKRRFVLHYTVMRPNDPRIKYFHTHIDRTQSK